MGEAGEVWRGRRAEVFDDGAVGGEVGRPHAAGGERVLDGGMAHAHLGLGVAVSRGGHGERLLGGHHAAGELGGWGGGILLRVVGADGVCRVRDVAGAVHDRDRGVVMVVMGSWLGSDVRRICRRCVFRVKQRQNVRE
jgi:hypothetical protein